MKQKKLQMNGLIKQVRLQQQNIHNTITINSTDLHSKCQIFFPSYYMTTANFMGLSLYQQMIYYTHMMLMTRNKFGYKDIFKSGILSHLSNTLNSEHFAERDAKAIFFLYLYYHKSCSNQHHKNSTNRQKGIREVIKKR